MRRRIFLRNFLRLLSIVLIPFLLFAPLSMAITYSNSITQYNQNSMDMLLLARENLELMLNDIDSLTALLDDNVRNSISLKTILQSTEHTFETLHELDFIQDILSTPTYSKPFIHSIYTYVPNKYGRYLSSATKVTFLDRTYDRGWYDSFRAKDRAVWQWVEARLIKSYAGDENPQKVITLYRRISSGRGVVVLNIRQSYFAKMIRLISRFNSSSLIVVDAGGGTLFTNRPEFEHDQVWPDFLGIADGKPSLVQVFGETHLRTAIRSGKFGWTYIAFIPARILYSAPQRILTLTLLIFGATLICVAALSFALARSNYRKIMRIIDLFEVAEEEQRIPIWDGLANDEYSYILHNILTTMKANETLKNQLAQKQLSLVTAELLALQSQLNPHFMFNTLETINLEILSLAKKPVEANRMIMQLAHLLRYALSCSGSMVRLNQEIENAKRYLDIQMARYEGKFFVRWRIDESVIDNIIVPLSLQPLLENCIYHGIKEKDGMCGIKVNIYGKNGILHIKVTDNGVGMEEEELIGVRERLRQLELNTGDHIGLFNTNRRFVLTYGERYCLSILSRKDIGTCVHIKISV